MTFRVRDLLIAISPAAIVDKNAVDSCTRCTGLTPDCPGCSRVQCSDFPTHNLGRDNTIYEAVENFRAAELLLLKADMKLAQQKVHAGEASKQAIREDDAELAVLEEGLTAALEEVRKMRKKSSKG